MSESNVAGGRLLGTAPAQQAVDLLTKDIKKLSAALASASTAFLGTARQAQGRGKAGAHIAGDLWNDTTNWAGWGTHNGGGATFGPGAKQFGLTQAGIQYNSPTTQPAGPSRPVAYGGSAARMLGGGKPNGGGPSGAGLAAVATGAATWGAKYTGDNVSGNLIGVQAANYGANGGNWGAAAKSRLTGQSYGLGLADRQQAQGMALTNLGAKAYNGGFDSSMRATGYLNPTMSATDMMSAQMTTGSARFHNQSRLLGIRTITAGGDARDVWDVNRDYGKRLGVGGAMTNAQIQASFGQNSKAVISLRNQGFTEDQITSFRSQNMATAKIMQQGGSEAEAKRLFNAAAGHGKGMHAAQATLQSKYGFSTSSIQTLKGQAAAADDARTNGIVGFNKGLVEASNSVEKFTNAVDTFLRKTHMNDAVGMAGGSASVISGALGAGAQAVGIGAGAYGTARMAARLAGKSMPSLTELAMKGLPSARAASQVGSVASKASHFGKFVPGVGLALQVGENVWHAKRAWNKGWETGKGNEKFSDMGWDMTNPAMAVGSLAGLGNTLGGIAGGQYDYVGPGGGRGGPTGGGGQAGGSHQGGSSGADVVARAAAISKSGRNFGVGYCQNFTRQAMGAPGGAPTAIAAYRAAKYKHPGDKNPPPGAGVFWSGGSTGAGHAAVSAGGGMVYSTDVKRPGKVDLVSIDWINKHWKAEHYQGWTEDNNGVRIKVGASTALASGATENSGGGDAGGSAGPVSGGSMSMGSAVVGSSSEADNIAMALNSSTGGSSSTGSASTSGAMTGSSSTPDAPGAGGSVTGNAALVKKMAAARGWKGSQWDALHALVQQESSFNNKAQNKSSTAYGLFQFLDSTWGGHAKTSDAGKQTQYGLDYIAHKYGDPSKAWSFHQKHNWYDKGAWNIDQDQGATVHKGEMIIPARQADTIRAALLKESIPTKSPTGSGSNSDGIKLVFNQGAITIKVDGEMDDAAARKAAKNFATYLSEDARLQTMAGGR